MHTAPVLEQLVQDRQQDRWAAAAAHQFAGSVSARTRIARTLRRAADRLDTASSPSAVSSALPGGGFSPPPGLSAS